VSPEVKITGPAKCLTLYVDETDQWHGQPLAAAIVALLQREGVAGATVDRGIEGFGAASRIHLAHPLRLSENLPVRIEVIDVAERIDRVLPLLDEMVGEGLITIQELEVIKYVPSPRNA
jgi:PII-like signaling protein